MTNAEDLKFIQSNPLLKSMEGPGQVVRITNPKHRYYGEEAVIQFSSPKMYHIRLLNKEKPFIDRFIFASDGKVGGTTSKYITLQIAKSSVSPIPGKKSNKNTNTWQGNTSKLLDTYTGMTKTQILKLVNK